MEIHRPHLTHNWREFLKEYGIIVLGVLTALLAEQAVQSFEWRHKVEAAIADMDNELSIGDGPQVFNWDLTTGKLIRRFVRHTATVLSVAFSPDGTNALSGAGDQLIARRRGPVRLPVKSVQLDVRNV